MRGNILKVITISFFFAMIVSFVAYRSGYLGGSKSMYPASPNGGALNNQLDSIPKNDSVKRIEIMPSSKVMILRDHHLQLADSSKLKSDTTFKIDRMMYSSKSGPILIPEDLKTLKLDTTEIDTLEK